MSRHVSAMLVCVCARACFAVVLCTPNALATQLCMLHRAMRSMTTRTGVLARRASAAPAQRSFAASPPLLLAKRTARVPLRARAFALTCARACLVRLHTGPGARRAPERGGAAGRSVVAAVLRARAMRRRL
jgi:hypothetical protein